MLAPMPVTPPHEDVREGDEYVVAVDGFERAVSLRRAGDALIAYLDFLNDRALVRACADRLAERLAPLARGGEPPILLAPEAGAIPLCFLVAERLDLVHVIARKRSRDYLPHLRLTVPVQSITALAPELLVLDDAAAERIAGRGVVLLDSVYSTGSTLGALERLAEAAGARVVDRAVAFTEGSAPPPGRALIALGHLPVFPV